MGRRTLDPDIRLPDLQVQGKGQEDPDVDPFGAARRKGQQQQGGQQVDLRQHPKAVDVCDRKDKAQDAALKR